MWLFSSVQGSTSGYTRKGEQLVRSCELFLTRLIITNDDARRYSDKILQCKNVRLKEPIKLDIYKIRYILF